MRRSHRRPNTNLLKNGVFGESISNLLCGVGIGNGADTGFFSFIFPPGARSVFKLSPLVCEDVVLLWLPPLGPRECDCAGIGPDTVAVYVFETSGRAFSRSRPRCGDEEGARACAWRSPPRSDLERGCFSVMGENVILCGVLGVMTSFRPVPTRRREPRALAARFHCRFFDR